MTLSIILIISIWLLHTDTNNRIFNQREQSDFFRFIASIIVVLGHQTLFYCNSTSKLIKNETDYGAICVAFFLFISGYGLIINNLIKENKIKEHFWLSRRLVKLIVPAITAMAVYLIFRASLGESIDWVNVVTWWFVSNDNLLYGWYVTEITLLYIVFYFCFRYMKMPYSIYSLTALIAVAMIVMVLYKMPVWYIRGLPCFVMGMFFAKYDTKHLEEGNMVYKTNPIIIKSIMTLLVVVFFLLKNFEIVQVNIPFLNRWRYMYISFYVVSPIFIIIIAYIIERMPSVNFMKNKGKYFYEIYLVQGASLMICRRFIENDILFIVFGIITTIIMAKYLNRINSIIINKINSLIYYV